MLSLRQKLDNYKIQLQPTAQGASVSTQLLKAENESNTFILTLKKQEMRLQEQSSSLIIVNKSLKKLRQKKRLKYLFYGYRRLSCNKNDTRKFSESKIISRLEWDAIPVPIGKPYFPHVPNKVIIHHYGFPSDKPNLKISKSFKGHASIRELQRDDIKELGLIDIKFHYIISPNVAIYEGRPSQYMGNIFCYDNGQSGSCILIQSRAFNFCSKRGDCMVTFTLTV